MPLPRSLQAAIVDLDGTMVHTLPDFVAALDAVMAELGLPALAGAQVARMVGKGSEHLVHKALEAAGGSPTQYEAAWDAYQRHYRAVNGRHSTVFPGVPEGLRALSAAGLHLACVTNKPTGFARALLQDKGLLAPFAEVFGGDAFARKKPDPLPILRACDALGAPPSATLVLGDSSNDAAAARAAGCPVALVTYGYNHGEPVSAAGADAYLDSLADVARLLPA